MKNFILFLAFVVPSVLTYGQIYTHSTTGVMSTFSGDCPVSTCSGTYFDDGGAVTNYSNGVNQIYRTFCPSTPGTCLRATFTAFNTELGWDYLSIGNGPAQNSPVFTTAPADGFGRIWGTPAVPFSFQSTNSSGCLTTRFFSDGSINRPGWSASLSCVPCAAAQPAGNSDCSAATVVCSNTAINDISNGPGTDATEGCVDCVTGENYSNWYTFLIQTTGTLELTIAPNSGTADFDFAIYGPASSCATMGAPIRCSYAAGTGNTGTQVGAGDTSEDVFGDGFVDPINVVAGEQYYLMVNNWTAGGLGFDLNWSGTASLDCTLLPVELLEFKGKEHSLFNELSWITATEENNSHFTLKRSVDGYNWEDIATISGAGNSSSENNYVYEDRNFERGKLTYYSLFQTDFDGETEDLQQVVVISNGISMPDVVKVLNMTGQEVPSDYEGLRIIYYSDGSIEKKLGK